MSSYPHFSVLLDEILDLFASHPPRIMVDGTLGAGGHAEALLKAIPDIQLLIGIDKDPDALKIAGERLAPYKDRVRLEQGSFERLPEIVESLTIPGVDGILLDLGVSSMQLDRAEKGFSFRAEGPLDMRMDPSTSLTAGEIVNTWSDQDLCRLFRRYGEELHARRIAKGMVHRRSSQPFATTRELAEWVEGLVGRKPRDKIHPATRVFQALRIAVNDELGDLERFLPHAIDLLSPEGRLAIISFHSLEDRIVKQTFQQAASDKESTSGLAGLFRDKEPTVNLLTRKPIIPEVEEIHHNPRSRSAKLRAVEKR